MTSLKILHMNLWFSYIILIDLFTHEPVIFAHYLIDLYLVSLLYKDLRKSYLLLHSFFKEIYQNQPFSLFKHVYLNSVDVKFQMLIAR